MVGRGRVGGTRLATVDVVGGSTPQTGPSQTVDPTQYQEHYEDPWLYHFDVYQQHQYEQPDMEQMQPDIEQPQQQGDIEQPQQ